MNLQILELADAYVTIGWTDVPDTTAYRVYWADRNTKGMAYKCLAETKDTQFRLNKATHVPHYFYVEAVADGQILETSERLKTPVRKVFHPQLEKLNRGLIAARTEKGIYLSWRYLGDEPDGIVWRIYRRREEGPWELLAEILPRDAAPESSYEENPGIVKKNTTPCCYVDPDGRAEPGRGCSAPGRRG